MRLGSCNVSSKFIFTEQDVLKEVGSYGMHTVCSEGHQTIYSLLSRADFAHEIAPGVWSPVSINSVSSKSELMHYITSKPFGVDKSATDIQYPGVDVHLKELEIQRRIFVLGGMCGPRVFANLLYNQPKEEQAICSLWKTACEDTTKH